MSKIEWTEKTWNPIVGCSVVSPGCTNCYAMKMAARLEAMAGDGLDDNGYATRGANPLGHYRGTTRKVKGNSIWSGELRQAPEHTLLEPLRRKKPTMWFVNSMSDLFHEDVPDEWIDRVFAVMVLCPQHTFQVLTKRAERMRAYMEQYARGERRIGDAARSISEDLFQRGFCGGYFVIPPASLLNVWLGVSAEDQKRADDRVPHLLQTPASVRFVSAEPLLGPINCRNLGDATFSLDAFTGSARHLLGMTAWTSGGLDWVIVGGESGSGARPMHPDWVRSIRDQCVAADVPFFFKQWGEYVSGSMCGKHGFQVDTDAHGHDIKHPFISSCTMMAGDPTAFVRVGKKAAGRLLNGRTWDEMPATASTRAAA